MVGCLLNNVLGLEKILRHQLTVVVLEAIQNVCHGVVDSFFSVADIHRVRFLDCGNYLLHGSLIYSCHFMNQKQFLGVCNPHVGIFVGGCAVQDDELTRVSWLDKESG